MSQPSLKKAVLAAVAATLAAVAGLTVFVVQARREAPPAADEVTVVLDGENCRPAVLNVPAGTTTFLIRNEGRRVMEWEIIQGVMVIEERENIAPGQARKMSVTLEPGLYDFTCSPKSKFRADLRGRLTVTPSADAPAGSYRPAGAELIGALAEYKFFVFEEAAELVEKTQAFTAAVKAGDVVLAKALYAPARVHYERIEPVAELFSDLDGAIDARADAFEAKETDPAFTGFHRLEHALWVGTSTRGMEGVADKLSADVMELQGRITSLAIPPEKMVGGAAALIEEVAANKISGEEDRYSHTDLWDFSANIEGAAKIVDLLRPLLIRADKPLLDKIDTNLASVKAVLGRYAVEGGGFQDYDKLTEADRNALQGPITVLAEDLSKLRGTLALN